MWTLPSLRLDDNAPSCSVEAHTTSQRMLRRCRIVLMAAEGVPNRRIAPVVGMNQNQVGTWRRRFEAERWRASRTGPARGRPRALEMTSGCADRGHGNRHQAGVGQPLEPLAAGRSAGRHGHLGISVGRIPGRARHQAPPGALVAGRPDHPAFWERAADVCGLYLSPPTNALVLSLDEKTAIPARSRRHATKPVAPGQVERQELSTAVTARPV